MQTQGDKRLLRRVEAATYVTETFGIPCAAKTLAKYASEGIGPAFRKAGPFPMYAAEDLDAWASSRLGPRVRSASAAREAA